MKTNKQIGAILLDFFDNGNKWGQGFYALDKYGRRVYEDSPYACKFCLFGALLKLKQMEQIDDDERSKFIRYVTKNIQKENETDTIARWNDDKDRTYADVEKLLKGIM